MDRIRKTLILLSALVVVSCNNEVLDECKKQQSCNNECSLRTKEEARNIVLQGLSMFGNNVTRSNKLPKRLNDSVSVVRKKISRSSDYDFDHDTLLYVFNFSDNQGYALILNNTFEARNWNLNLKYLWIHI